MKYESLIQALQSELKQSTEDTYPIYINSFANLLDYEFGSLDELPIELDNFASNRIIELGIFDDEII